MQARLINITGSTAQFWPTPPLSSLINPIFSSANTAIGLNLLVSNSLARTHLHKHPTLPALIHHWNPSNPPLAFLIHHLHDVRSFRKKSHYILPSSFFLINMLVLPLRLEYLLQFSVCWVFLCKELLQINLYFILLKWHMSTIFFFWLISWLFVLYEFTHGQENGF